jgi:putative DNA methylase
MGVFSRFRAVLEDDGKPMSARTALALIHQMRSEIDHDDDAGYDAETRFALEWFSEANWEPRDSGRAILLANAMNLSLDRLVRAGIIHAQGGKTRLVPREAYMSEGAPGSDKIVVWTAAQCLANVLDRPGGGQEKAAEVFGHLGTVRELVQALIYRLHSLANDKKWTREALVWNRLGEEWNTIGNIAESLESNLAARAMPPDLFGARP